MAKAHAWDDRGRARRAEGRGRGRQEWGEKSILGGDRKCCRVSQALVSTLASALNEKDKREVTGLNLDITSAAVVGRDDRGKGRSRESSWHAPAVFQVGEAVWLKVYDAGGENVLDSGYAHMVESTASVHSGRGGRRNGEGEEEESHRGYQDLGAGQPEGRSYCELL